MLLLKMQVFQFCTIYIYYVIFSSAMYVSLTFIFFNCDASTLNGSLFYTIKFAYFPCSKDLILLSCKTFAELGIYGYKASSNRNRCDLDVAKSGTFSNSPLVTAVYTVCHGSIGSTGTSVENAIGILLSKRVLKGYTCLTSSFPTLSKTRNL